MDIDTLRVLYCAAEAAPFSKVGGLADVARSLPVALRRQNIDIRLMIPRYGIPKNSDVDMKRFGHPIPVPVGPAEEPAHLFEAEVESVPVYLLWNDQYFVDRDKIYGFSDDPKRFLYFARAIIAALPHLGWKPDIIHVNDWHTAAVPAWLDVYGRTDPFYADIASVFTIHNLAYQGVSGRLLLSFGRMSDLPHLAVEPPGKVNWLAQGIAHADVVNTVSPTVAKEMLDSSTFGPVSQLLRERHKYFFSILSGIDSSLWDPDVDSSIAQTYNVDTLSMRAVNKAALQREFGLEVNPRIPLLGIVARLDQIKGFDLLMDVVRDLVQTQRIQFVLLGIGEDQQIAQNYRDLQSDSPGNVRVLFRFDEAMSRRIYSSIDIFLMPSRIATNSVGVMLAMRYGAIPVVRATGGLADVVTDVSRHPASGTGFTFTEYTTDALRAALDTALDVYQAHSKWASLQKRAMSRDCSWSQSAQAYIALYRKALTKHSAR